MVTKIIKAFLGLLFIVFAAVQYNDPDPYAWMAIYGVVGLVFLVSLLRPVSKRAVGFLIIALLVYSLTFIPGFWEWLNRPEKSEIFGEMIYDRPYIEQTREFLGLLIACSALFYLYRKS
ncbi:MAG: transmembrane 220 family protein [Cytophagales bacterium]|nr:transmembrane 220 family protein [Cytophagales bacterium]